MLVSVPSAFIPLRHRIASGVDVPRATYGFAVDTWTSLLSARWLVGSPTDPVGYERIADERALGDAAVSMSTTNIESFASTAIDLQGLLALHV